MRLFYFTYSYPYGLGEQWKANELNVLVKYFDEITVVPFFYGGNYDHPKKMPDGVKLKGPLFKEDGLPAKKTDLLRFLFHKNAANFLGEFFKKKVFVDKQRFRSWLGATKNAVRILEHPVTQEIIAGADKDTVLYFYWGKGLSEMLPFINTKKFRKTFVRMHRFDLFEYVNNNYIPYRKPLLDQISVAAPSSIAGREHLRLLYPNAKAAIEVYYCGTIGNGKKSMYSEDNILRVVSCSVLSQVKRVHIMIESLQFIDFPVQWYHLGDGPLENELKLLAKKLGVADKFFFEGMISSEKVSEYYAGHRIDIFVNTSSSEGLPFSIMEAFAAAIPVMATGVGGTGEIVDEKVGRLLPADLDGKILAAALRDFYQLPFEEKKKLRENAFERYREKWDAKKLAKELAESLQS